MKATLRKTHWQLTVIKKYLDNIDAEDYNAQIKNNC